MTVHVDNPEIVAQLQEFATLRGIDLDGALKLAVEEALARDRAAGRLRAMREVVDRVASAPRTGHKADKAFFDELSGDEDWTPEQKLRRIRQISAEVSSWPRTGLPVDKAFYDELSGDE